MRERIYEVKAFVKMRESIYEVEAFVDLGSYFSHSRERDRLHRVL